MYRSVILLVGFLVAAPACAQTEKQKLFSASARSQGLDFAMTVAEVAREASFSTLEAPSFHKRSAAESRWLMCAYSALALKRGFTHWLAQYPTETSETILVAFTNSDTASTEETFGSRLAATERVVPKVPMPVSKMAAFCGLPGRW
ncbi:MAG: hypothetical protein WCV99_00370 [Sterolibacterium sp.]|jgi:hypothetical protein